MLLDNGARDLLLYGYSMGVGFVANFLIRSPLADRVAAVVLDAPMRDFEETVNYGAERRTLPGSVTATAKWFAGQRFDIDWEGMDYLNRAAAFSPPILLIHGDDDDLVPIRISDALAARRGDIVTYVRLADTPHVAGWNVPRAEYEQAGQDFLGKVAP